MCRHPAPGSRNAELPAGADPLDGSAMHNKLGLDIQMMMTTFRFRCLNERA